MKQSKIKLIGTAAIYLILMLGIAWFSAMKNEESIKDKSKIAFLTAIKQEKELFIPQVIINFNPSSANRIPVEEKIDWSAQFYLAMEDSCRHRFDSIFREEMKKQGIEFESEEDLHESEPVQKIDPRLAVLSKLLNDTQDN